MRIRRKRSNLRTSRVQARVVSGVIHGQTIPVDSFLDPQHRRNQSTVHEEPQLHQLVDWLNGSTDVDLLLLQIGGNDANFEQITADCLENFGGAVAFTNCRHDSTIAALVAGGLAAVPSVYNQLETEIRFVKNLSVRQITVFGYPDPTRDCDGNFCSPEVSVTQACWGVLQRRIPAADFQFLFNSFLSPMNNALKAFVNDPARQAGSGTIPKWTFVDMASTSTKKGLCNCNQGWFNTVGQSDNIQGDLLGSIHPNQRGQNDMMLPQVNNVLTDAQTKLIAIPHAVAIAALRTRGEL